jgi:hypothetical protein
VEVVNADGSKTTLDKKLTELENGEKEIVVVDIFEIMRTQDVNTFLELSDRVLKGEILLFMQIDSYIGVVQGIKKKSDTEADWSVIVAYPGEFGLCDLVVHGLQCNGNSITSSSSPHPLPNERLPEASKENNGKVIGITENGYKAVDAPSGGGEGAAFNLNLENGEGEGSVQQKGGKASAIGAGSVALNGGYDSDDSDALGVRANGVCSIAGGIDSVTYQIGSYSVGKDCIAGMTAKEFLEKYPNEIDDWGKTYAESWSLAHAEGLETEARGRNSHAQNRGTKALANDSSASGVESEAHGSNGANANGFKTKAIGADSFTANNQAVASGDHAASFNTGGDAAGTNAFKTGDNNYSKGACSSTFGADNTAFTYCAFVGGKNSQSSTTAQYTFQYGEGLRIVANNQAVVGKYNINDSSAYNGVLPVFTVGYGTSDNDRKDVFNVLRDGRAKVYGAPTEENDVVRKKELDEAIANVGGELYQHNIHLYKSG